MAARIARFIDCATLAPRLAAGSCSLLDATWAPPGISGRPQFNARRLPGALFFDVDEVADPATSLPHMLPSAADFSRHMSALRVTKARTVVVYDAHGLLAAGRAAFTLAAFGHPDVRILLGGLPRWLEEGLPLEEGAPPPPPGAPLPEEPWDLDPSMVAGLEEVRAVSAASAGARVAPEAPLIVDARGAARFLGEAPEPRPGLLCGHIPGSRNVPFPSVQVPGYGPLLGARDLAGVLRAAGVDPARPGRIILSCGSGVTAPIVWLALVAAGREGGVAVYDGSFAEWGLLEGGNPVAKGPAAA